MALQHSALSRHELFEVIEQLPFPVAIADASGIIRRVSFAWQLQVASIGLELQVGTSLLAHQAFQSEQLFTILSDYCHTILEGQALNAELKLQPYGDSYTLQIKACIAGGERGLLLTLHMMPAIEAADLQAITGALRERDLQFTAIAANLPGILYRVVLYPDGTIDFPYISPDTTMITGRPHADHWLDRIHPDDRNEFYEVLRGSAQQLLPFDLEQRVISASDQEIWVRNITRPHRRSDGAVVWDGMVLDISAQKRVERDLQNSLRDKDALLQEVHHRVKNNLQIISSLLDLQAITTPDPAIQQVFIESRRRIRAMALVHEQLYHVESMARIDFRTYVRTLVEYLQQSFLSNASRVSFQIVIEGIWLDAHAAIPCGLVINELVSNALKHAFPDQRSGAIQIDCYSTPEKQLVLSVSDNGIGLPNTDFQNTGTLGLKLVRTLARQLRGKLTIENRGGVVVTLTFTPTLTFQNQ